MFLMALLTRHWPLAGSLALLPLLPLGEAQFSTTHRSTVLTDSGAATRARVEARYGELPLAFEINQGQTDVAVRFLAHGAGYSLFLIPTEAVLALRPASPNVDLATDRPGHRAMAPIDPAPSTVMRLALAGANPAPIVEGLDLQPGRSHYLIGNDPARWQRNVARFGKVKYHQVYPGVDLVYYGNQRQLEYDFVVAPGADPGRIQLKPSGVQSLKLDEHGNLVLGTGHGDVLQHKPRIYQDIAGKRRMVDGRYALLDEQRVGFVVGQYDTTQALVIDPVLAYSTYLGGSDIEAELRIAVDGDGNAYVTGSTRSTNFPTASAHQGSNAGHFDAFVTKLNAAGNSLVYSTYLGGSSNDDYGRGIAVDGAGNVYVAGATGSTDFPTVAAIQPAYAGGNFDAFVAKLNPSGSALLYSTYLGGNEYELARSIAVDSAGNAYVTGDTGSQNFPTAAPLQANYGGCGEYDAFVTKFNATGRALVYSTYLGGCGLEQSYGIAVDGAGNAYVGGYTGSSNFPTTSPLQAAFAGGPTDAFVAKLNAAGNAWVYRTYLGGNGGDLVFGIAIDSGGNAYITGSTESTNFPTLAAFQPMHGGGFIDAYVSKINASGRALVYSTYLGGNGSDGATAIAVDNTGAVSLIGRTFSTNFPVAASLQTVADPTHGEGFVTKLSSSGAALAYSTYLGGAGADIGTGIAVDASGNAYVVGATDSVNFPTIHPLQSANGGMSDGFVAKVATAVVSPASPRNDFNGDHHSDILWRNHATGADAIWKSASSAATQNVTTVASQSWQVAGVGDFNSDDKADILWRNASTGSDVIWKSGSSASTQSVAAVTSQAWQVAGVGDFNGDGKADILWRNNTSGADAIWNSGLDSTPQAISGVTDPAWHIVGVDDFDGDGKADILWRNASTGSNVIWKSGNAATRLAVSGVTSQAWRIVATGDFNGDGKADILWRDSSTGADVIWKSGLASTQQAVTAVTNLDWHIVAAGDYNGDGTGDILWRNLATGADVIWKSARSSTQQAVTKVSSLSWVVEPAD
jgi:hypothetical protein